MGTKTFCVLEPIKQDTIKTTQNISQISCKEIESDCERFFLDHVLWVPIIAENRFLDKNKLSQKKKYSNTKDCEVTKETAPMGDLVGVLSEKQGNSVRYFTRAYSISDIRVSAFKLR